MEALRYIPAIRTPEPLTRAWGWAGAASTLTLPLLVPTDYLPGSLQGPLQLYVHHHKQGNRPPYAHAKIIGTAAIRGVLQFGVLSALLWYTHLNLKVGRTSPMKPLSAASTFCLKHSPTLQHQLIACAFLLSVHLAVDTAAVFTPKAERASYEMYRVNCAIATWIVLGIQVTELCKIAVHLVYFLSPIRLTINCAYITLYLAAWGAPPLPPSAVGDIASGEELYIFLNVVKQHEVAEHAAELRKIAEESPRAGVRDNATRLRDTLIMKVPQAFKKSDLSERAQAVIDKVHPLDYGTWRQSPCTYLRKHGEEPWVAETRHRFPRDISSTFFFYQDELKLGLNEKSVRGRFGLQPPEIFPWLDVDQSQYYTAYVTWRARGQMPTVAAGSTSEARDRLARPAASGLIQQDRGRGQDRRCT